MRAHPSGTFTAALSIVVLVTMAFTTPAEPGPRSVSDGPILFSTLVGGSDIEWLHDVEVGPDGSVYVTGYTKSSNYPTTAGAYQRAIQGAEDVFVTRLSSNGTQVEWSTLLGGSGQDIPWAMSLGPDGSVYVTGLTSSSNLPTTIGAFSDTLDGDTDAFVARIAADGSSLVYSTYLGGENKDEGYSVLTMTDGSAYVAGHTESTFFPTTSRAYDGGLSGWSDVFVSRLSSDGRILQASTFLGGSYSEWEPRLARGADGGVWVTGSTTSLDYPTSAGAFQRVAGLGRDVFVSRLGPNLDAMGVSTLVARDGNDVPRSIDLGPDGQVMVAGHTNSLTFPSHEGSTDLDNYGDTDGFILALKPDLSALEHSELIGGSLFDLVRTARYDPEGTVHLLGFTNSTDFPTTADAVKSYKVSDNHDLMYLEMDLEAHTVSHATLIGPAEGDFGMDLALDPLGVPVLGGHTRSPSFITTEGCYDASYNGGGDLVVLRYSTDVDPPEFLQHGPTGTVNTGTDMHLFAMVVDGTGIGEVQVEVWFDDGSPRVLHMDPDHGYSTHVPVPEDAYQVRYRFTAWDVLGRANTTEVGVADVVDVEPPRLVKDLTTSQGTTGDSHEVRVQLSDNRGGVTGATLALLIEGTRTDRPMTRSLYEPGVWTYTFLVPSGSISPIGYRVSFVDEAGNTNETGPANIGVLDDDPPELGELDAPSTALPGTSITINVSAWDNIGITSAWLEYIVSGSHGLPASVSAEGPFLPCIVVDLPIPDGRGTIVFELKAEDAAGHVTTLQAAIAFADDDPPRMSGFTYPETATTGDPFVVEWKAEDHSLVTLMWVSYAFGEVPQDAWETIEVVEIFRATAEIPVPASENRTLHVVFGARDEYLNENETDPISFQVVDDDPPVADAGPDQTFEEGQMVLLNGSRSTDNVGIVAFQWSWVEPGAEEPVETRSELPWVLLVVEPGRYRVTLTVTDGAGNTDTDVVDIVVKARDDTSGPFTAWVLLAVAGIAVAIIVLGIHVDRRRRT